VTVQRREESAQKVLVTASVIRRAMLHDRNITRLDQVIQLVLNLNLAEIQERTCRILRGIGLAVSRPAGEVWSRWPLSTMSSVLRYRADRRETLFGRNTIGGITDTKAAVSGPTVGNTQLGRLAIQTRYHEGYGRVPGAAAHVQRCGPPAVQRRLSCAGRPL
jgi:hypothetical protein